MTFGKELVQKMNDQNRDSLESDSRIFQDCNDTFYEMSFLPEKNNAVVPDTENNDKKTVRFK